MNMVEKIIEKLNDGDMDTLEGYFGDIKNVFLFLDKKGVIDELDPHDGYDHWQNAYLLYLSKNKPDLFKEKIQNLMSDLRFEGDQAIFSTHNKGEDLSRLFCDTRNQSRETIKNVLNGDIDFDWISDTTDDVYDDVIQVLNNKNLNILYENILFELKDKNVTPDTELLELIAEEQNHPEYVSVNMENISRIIDDEESTNFLLDEYLYDLKSNLYSIHSNATNNAYGDEAYENVLSELSRYFITPGKYTSVPHPYKKNTTVEVYELPIRDFYGDIKNYLQDNENYGGYNSIEYFGNFIETLCESVNCLYANYPDYADYDKVIKNVNEFFGDYL